MYIEETALQFMPNISLVLNMCYLLSKATWMEHVYFLLVSKATASNDSSVKLWDMKTGKEKAQLKGHQAAVYSVAFSVSQQNVPF